MVKRWILRVRDSATLEWPVRTRSESFRVHPWVYIPYCEANPILYCTSAYTLSFYELKDNEDVFLDGRHHNQKLSDHKEYEDTIYHDQDISECERNKIHKEEDEAYQNSEISDFEMNNLPKQEMVRDASVSLYFRFRRESNSFYCADS
jgi:hypothetical protein